MLDLSFHRVRPEKVDRLRDWLRSLSDRREEVLETFRREGTRHEKAALLMTSEGPVLAYAIERDPAIDGQAVFLSSELAIDKEHLAVLKECLVGYANAEVLFDIAP
jgi:hypothetical protein